MMDEIKWQACKYQRYKKQRKSPNIKPAAGAFILYTVWAENYKRLANVGAEAQFRIVD